MGVKVIRKSGRKDWYLSVCHGGKRYIKHVGSREAAYASKKDIEEALATGAFILPKEKDAAKGTTFRVAVGRWQKEHVGVNLKPSTKQYYGSIVEDWLIPTFGDTEVAAITRADVKAAVARWKEEKERPSVEDATPAPGEKKARKRQAGKGLRSIPNALRSLRSFFSWAIEEELVSSNPVEKPSKIFKVGEAFRGDFLRPEEVPLYLDGVRMKAPRYFPLLRTLTFTGLRVGEAIALKWGNIDWNGKYLTVQESSWEGHVTSPKTSSSVRRVDLSSETIEVLQQYRKAVAAQSLKAGRSMPETVFVNEYEKSREGKEVETWGGKPMDPSKIRKAHELGLKEAGLRHIRIHDLRGTFASLLVSAGVPIYYVSKALGHADVTTTSKHYADLAPGAAKEMPNVLERFVFGAPAGRDANGMRTEAETATAPPEGESATA
jgi:integrase